MNRLSFEAVKALHDICIDVLYSWRSEYNEEFRAAVTELRDACRKVMRFL